MCVVVTYVTSVTSDTSDVYVPDHADTEGSFMPDRVVDMASAVQQQLQAQAAASGDHALRAAVSQECLSQGSSESNVIDCCFQKPALRGWVQVIKAG